MADSLKKLEYNDLNQFLEDLNSNMALIQNSPLFKGVPGTPGIKGDGGTIGNRGSQIIFAIYSKFNSIFPGELTNSTKIDLTFINSKLNSYENKQKLLSALGVEELVNNDIVVLPSSEMISFVFINSAFINTGIAFNPETNLTENINTIVNDAINEAIQNNTTLNNLEVLFERYQTIAKNYSDTNNTGLTGTLTESALLYPKITGLVNESNGVDVPTNLYFGINKNKFTKDETASLVLGSVEKYVELLNSTTTTASGQPLSSDYGPGITKIPSLIVLQNTNNDGSGILLGFKNDSNLKRFASIYKDSDNYLVLKSDGGPVASTTEFSKLKIGKNKMLYDKAFEVSGELWARRDLRISNNIISPLINTNNILNPIDNTPIWIMDFGNNAQTTLNNRFENIWLPNWNIGNVLVTMGTGRVLQKNYYIESNGAALPFITALPVTTGLNTSTKLPATNADKKFVTSYTVNQVLAKVDEIASFVNTNYWTKTGWANASITDALKIAGTFETTKDFISPLIKSNLTNNSAQIGKDANSNVSILGNFSLPKYANKLLVTDNNGLISQDYTLDSEDLSLLPDEIFNYSAMPGGIGPETSPDAMIIPDNVGSRGIDKILTGKTNNFIIKSLNNIKKRFLNTFSKDETLFIGRTFVEGTQQQITSSTMPLTAFEYYPRYLCKIYYNAFDNTATFIGTNPYNLVIININDISEIPTDDSVDICLRKISIGRYRFYIQPAFFKRTGTPENFDFFIFNMHGFTGVSTGPGQATNTISPRTINKYLNSDFAWEVWASDDATYNDCSFMLTIMCVPISVTY